MSKNDSRLDEFAEKILSAIKMNKTLKEQLLYLKTLLFNIPIMHTLTFPPQLTARELQVLYFAASGATIKETAKNMNIMPSTVISYRKDSIRKMKCRNVTEAVFKCFSYGLLL